MGAWFNGRPMSYATPEFRKWWSTFNPTTQAKPFGKYTATPYSHMDVQYSDQFPDMEPGKLWWPTGAGRFGIYYGLADHETVEAWRAETGGSNASELTDNPGIFLMSDQSDPDDYIERPMYMLPPRPLTFSWGDAPTYLITLVDERYHWWNIPIDDLSVEPITTWDELFKYFRGKLKKDTSTFVYKKPGEDYYFPGELIGRASHLPLPVLMDAAAWSVGCRIVVDFDYAGEAGQIIVQDITDAKTNRTATIAGQRILSGGQYKMQGLFTVAARDSAYIIPEKIMVSYPRYTNNGPKGIEDGRTGIEVKTADVPTFDGYKTGGVAVIHDTARAYKDGSTDEKLRKLAKVIAQDYLSWAAEENTDATLYGLRYTYPCGLFDAVEFHEYIADATELLTDEEDGYTIEDEKQQVIAYTKITRAPWLWRAFTLHHSVGGSSSSVAGDKVYTWVIDCGAGTIVTQPGTPQPPTSSPTLPPSSSSDLKTSSPITEPGVIEPPTKGQVDNGIGVVPQQDQGA